MSEKKKGIKIIKNYIFSEILSTKACCLLILIEELLSRLQEFQIIDSQVASRYYKQTSLMREMLRK